MSNYIHLISIDKLKDVYSVDDNVSDKYIMPLVKKCQDKMIKTVIEEEYFTELLTQASGGTLTELNEKFIVDYIQPALAYYVQSEIFYSTEYKIKNMGAGEYDNFKNILLIAQKFLDDAKYYLNAMEQFMCDNDIPFNVRYKKFQGNIFFPLKNNKTWIRNYQKP